jgi:hypothetical protein
MLRRCTVCDGRAKGEDLHWEAMAAGCCSSLMADGAISGATSIWRVERCEHPYQANEMCPPWGLYCCCPTSSSH